MRTKGTVATWLVGITLILAYSLALQGQTAPTSGKTESISSSGEESGFVPVSISNMVLVFHDMKIGIQFYESIRGQAHSGSGGGMGDASDRQFAFSPYFVFLRTSSERYKGSTNPDHTENVQLTLALYDEDVKRAAAQWLSAKIGSTVSVTSVQPLPIWELTITEATTGVTVRYPGDRTRTTRVVLQPTQFVKFGPLSPATAKNLREVIDSGTADFRFTYAYKKADTTIGSATIKYKDIYNSSIFQQLTGGGTSAAVTRDGTANVASRVVTSMEISGYLENADQASLVDDVQKLFLDKMQYKSALDFSKAENLRVLNALSIDPRGPDFEAQKITRIHEALKTSKDYSELNKKILDLGASGSYGPFSANASFKSNEDVNKAIKETFDHDWTGNDWSTVPKTVNIYQINGGDFRGESQVRQVQVRAAFSLQPFEVQPMQLFPSAQELQQGATGPYPDELVIVPIGTIVAFGGQVTDLNRLPTGWAICDGRPLKKNDFPKLYEVLGTLHGDGRDPNNNKLPGFDFNLPNLQGYFLRGVDSEGKVDPNTDKRRKVTGEAYAGVGSVEDDAVGPHRHWVANATAMAGGTGPLEYTSNGGFPATHFTDDREGVDKNPTLAKETRPKNKAVYYIIRIR